MNEKHLLELKEDIEQAKTKLAELKGREEYLMQQLELEWDCKTIEDAEEVLRTVEKEIEELDEQIEEGVKKIEEKMAHSGTQREEDEDV